MPEENFKKCYKLLKEKLKDESFAKYFHEYVKIMKFMEVARTANSEFYKTADKKRQEVHEKLLSMIPAKRGDHYDQCLAIFTSKKYSEEY